MFPLSDSLKYICRERERWRQADRERGRKRATLGQSHSWNTDLDKSGKHKHIVSGLKGEGGALLPKIFHPGDPSKRQGTPLSHLPITARSNYLFFLGVNFFGGLLCKSQQVLGGHNSPVGWERYGVRCSHSHTHNHTSQCKHADTNTQTYLNKHMQK